MHFSRLRLQGFKSFVDPTDLVIQEGLTGIVGPNGCGKSNLVEALRWVMGETSPKRMRGAGMEDVIFAGTATRPSRNLAEVTLELDNSDRSATAEYNNSDELHVVRKIERGGGSDYRVNGKPVRQRDVQLIFADQSTGAQSTSVVGQGQIDALIRAKPQDRRQILEEASGTAGLQARRHEAELKLKGAETNLTRVDDVLRTLDTQLRSLKQQVKQASRYRNLAEHIRKTEAALLHLRWLEAEVDAAKTRDALVEAEKQVNDLLVVVTRETAERTEIAAGLPALRQSEATAAAIVQKLTLAREQIDAEAHRLSDQIKASENRLDQSQNDFEREKSRHHDSLEAISRLRAEQTELVTKAETLEASVPALNESVATITVAVDALDSALSELMKQAANAEASEQALGREMQALLAKQAMLTQRRADIDTQRTALAEELAARSDLSLASEMVKACETELERRKEQAQQAEQARHDAQAAQDDARTGATQADGALTKLQAEARALEGLLAHHDRQYDEVIDLITVTPGLENALAVALGEALTAALDSAATMHWRELPPLDDAAALPSGATPLAQYIKAPAALARSLGQIGLVDNRQQGENAAAALKAGQILVSRDGWAWRWDGFTLTPEAKTSSAMRLQQRNRLAALQDEISLAETVSASAGTALLEATTLLGQCQELDGQTRTALQAAFAALNDARDHLARQEREAAAANAKLTSLTENWQQVNEDMETLRNRAAEIDAQRAALPNIGALHDDITTKRVALAEARGEKAQKQSERDRCTQEIQACIARQKSVKDDLAAWQGRMTSAETQSLELAERIESLKTELITLRAKPAELDAQRGTLMTQLSDAEAKRREAADILIATEQKLSVTEHQLKQDEASLGRLREERVRCEAAVTACDEHFKTLRERAAEKLGCTPDDLKEIASFGDGESLPSVFELEQLLGRYLKERDNMGPVNLRAEVEAEAAQTEIDRLQKEKDDLVAAIAKLRQGIGQLNREARERLQIAFTQVNERFQVLFTKLFGGGKASLELIDNEDPMNAGLEIFAAPPGKKQQILSLLSGGERTLTALALLFAVFQTNPSPICVLDEAEAALDESNIGRFCELVQHIGRETSTRFLIITHQRVTMAHMDRLFGVTMSEKGVSQLVSVDLANAVALRDGRKLDTQAMAVQALADVQAA
ncbi:MAG TPA: chromosome segregation protein SMC [Rhodospirillaceae bacterium]|nr:chromosome segregation protein SMC [Rhodospirillaceae bacterium]